MRFAERELAEIEKKHVYSDSGVSSASVSLIPNEDDMEVSAAAGKPAGAAASKSSESNKEKLQALSKQISEETRRIVLLRAELKSRTDAAGGHLVASFKDSSGGKVTSPGFSASLNQISGGGSASKGSAGGTTGEGTRGGALRPVPEEIIPELCQYVLICFVHIHTLFHFF